MQGSKDRKRRLGWAMGAATALALVVAGPAAAATPSVGTLDLGGTAPASQVLSFSWGMSNSGSAHTGGGMGAGRVNVQDFSFVKHWDANSSALMRATAMGTHFDEVEVVVPVGGKGSPFSMTYTFEEVLVTAYSTGASGGESLPTESVALNMAKFKTEFSGFPDQGFGWNIAENEEL